MPDSCHTPCKGRKASCTRPRRADSWLVPADMSTSCRWPLVLVKQSSLARAFRVAFLATASSFHQRQGVDCTIQHPCRRDQRCLRPSSALLVGAPPTELRHDGARGLQRANSDRVKSYFRQRVQNPLRFNLKCGLIAASPARAATPAPRHSRAPAAIPRQSPQNQGGRRLCGGPEAQSCAGDPCCNSAACGPRTPTFRSWKPPLVITRVSTASFCPPTGDAVSTMREAIWDMSWGWCAFTADVGVLRQGGAKCGDRLTCAAPARLVQHVAYAY